VLKLYFLLLHFTGQTAVTIYIATGIWLVPTTTVIGTFSMARILANSGAPGGQLRLLLLLLQSQLHWLPLPNNTATTPHQHSPIAFSPFFKKPKAKHTLPPRIASTCPNPHCTSRAHVFQHVQKHITVKNRIV
jgi:hypothetical protein